MARKRGPKPKPADERFWKMVDIRGVDDCWRWQGAHTTLGYGQVWDRDLGRPTGAHRLAFKLAYCREAWRVQHKCKTRDCVNPAHLEEQHYAEWRTLEG